MRLMRLSAAVVALGFVPGLVAAQVRESGKASGSADIRGWLRRSRCRPCRTTFRIPAREFRSPNGRRCRCRARTIAARRRSGPTPTPSRCSLRRERGSRGSSIVASLMTSKNSPGCCSRTGILACPFFPTTDDRLESLSTFRLIFLPMFVNIRLIFGRQRK